MMCARGEKSGLHKGVRDGEKSRMTDLEKNSGAIT